MENLPGRVADDLLSDLRDTFQSLQGCCLHSPVWTPADVEAALCHAEQADGGSWAQSAEYCGYADTASYTVVRLKDGTFGLLSESSDTSGHGCQCDAATNTCGSIAELLRFGIVEEPARDLIRNLLAVPGKVVADSGELESGTAQQKAVHQ